MPSSSPTPTTPVPLLVKRYVFSDANIQAAIDKAVASLPDNHSSALVAYGEKKPNGTYDVAVAAKLGSQWSIAIGAAKEHDQPLSAAAEVIFSW